MSNYRIGDEVYIHGIIDEIRKDTIIIKNEGGYFGTVSEEIMPSAQPEWKKGRWVKHGTGHSIYYDCSLCGCVAPCTEVGDSFIWKLSTYCPDCGAKMGNDGKRLRTVEVKKNDF